MPPSATSSSSTVFSKIQEKSLVVITIKKIQPYGFFSTLDEFENVDAFCHISEVSSGWVKSVRDYVKEGQKTVALVLRIDREKRQVDLSLKRASEIEKKRKLEQFNFDKRAAKLLERASLKLKKQEELKQVQKTIQEEYGDLWTVFQDAYDEKKLFDKIPKHWQNAISEIAKVEIKEKIITLRAILKLTCYSSNGINVIKQVLEEIESFTTKNVKVQTLYIGAPVYYVDVTSNEFKDTDKTLSKIQKYVEDNAKKLNIECEITKTKK